MAGFVTALTGENGLTLDSLWGSITGLVPVIVTLVIFAFSYGRVRKATKAASKGKVNM